MAIYGEHKDMKHFSNQRRFGEEGRWGFLSSVIQLCRAIPIPGGIVLAKDAERDIDHGAEV